MDLRAPLHLSAQRTDRQISFRSQLVVRSQQDIGMDGRHFGGTFRLPPYHTKDFHPYQPTRRYVCRSAPLHRIEHLPGLVVHATDEENTKSEALEAFFVFHLIIIKKYKQEDKRILHSSFFTLHLAYAYEDKRYRTDKYQPFSW